MKVLFLLRLWPVYGGGEAMTRLWANEFTQIGIDVHIAYFKYTLYGMTPVIDKRIHEHYISGDLCDEFTPNDVEDTYNACAQLCKIINDESIDIVINQWLPKSFVRNIKKDTNAKVVWCLRTIFAMPFEKPQERWRRLKYTLFPTHYRKRIQYNAVKNVEDVLPYVDKYVFLSNAYVEQYIAWSKNPDIKKVTAIPNPISINDKISETEIKEKENVVLVVGRMQECTKRYSIVLKVWQMVEKSSIIRDAKWHLVMVGDGADLPYYKQLARELKLRNITFEGFQDPVKYYKKAKIFLMTSRIEGFANVLLEAQQFGVVPIALDSYPAVRDVIHDGYNGILVHNDNLWRMKNELLCLMKNEQERCKLSNHGLEFVENYSLDNILQRWNCLLTELLK